MGPEQALQAARMSLVRAQKDTQEAFMRYTTCLDIERQARMAVTAAEKRRDDISKYCWDLSFLYLICDLSGTVAD